MLPVGILERHEPLNAFPRFHVKRAAAKYLIEKGLAIAIEGRKNLLRLLIGLRDVAEPIRELLKRWKHADKGNLLPPLEFYMPWVDVPEWILRSYRGKAA